MSGGVSGFAIPEGWGSESVKRRCQSLSTIKIQGVFGRKFTLPDLATCFVVSSPYNPRIYALRTSLEEAVAYADKMAEQEEGGWK